MEFDSKFISKLKAQEHNTFNEFYLRTVDIFFRYINANYSISPQDSEDIVADFYVKFRWAIVRHDIKQSFSGYCWTIFKNTIKDYFKKNTDLPFTELESRNEDNSSFEENIIDEEDLTEFLETDFKFEQIQKAMKELDDLSKDIVYRKFIEEKSYDEIGLLLNISQENIRQKVSRAIKQLKQLLE